MTVPYQMQAPSPTSVRGARPPVVESAAETAELLGDGFAVSAAVGRAHHGPGEEGDELVVSGGVTPPLVGVSVDHVGHHRSQRAGVESLDAPARGDLGGMATVLEHVGKNGLGLGR